MQNKKLVKIV